MKVRFGIHAQNTPVRPIDKNFNEAVELLVLNPNKSLSFDVIHEEGILGSYTIEDAEKGGVLNEETKAYQVSLFNTEKPVGMIKYQLDWLKPK